MWPAIFTPTMLSGCNGRTTASPSLARREQTVAGGGVADPRRRTTCPVEQCCTGRRAPRAKAWCARRTSPLAPLTASGSRSCAAIRTNIPLSGQPVRAIGAALRPLPFDRVCSHHFERVIPAGKQIYRRRWSATSRRSLTPMTGPEAMTAKSARCGNPRARSGRCLRAGGARRRSTISASKKALCQWVLAARGRPRVGRQERVPGISDFWSLRGMQRTEVSYAPAAG